MRPPAILYTPEQTPNPAPGIPMQPHAHTHAQTHAQTHLTLHAGAQRALEPYPRVQVHPSAPGTVVLVGMTGAGEWVGELRCLARDLSDSDFAEMESRVEAHERRLRDSRLRVLPEPSPPSSSSR